MAINLNVGGNTDPLEAAVRAAVDRIRRQPIKMTVDDKGVTQPLGNMKRGADEFSKSMEAANARIIAFGASMAILNGISDAFKQMVKNLVEVEKALQDINVVMGLSSDNLDRFSSGLFKVAKETGAAFQVAADAATEYARQGLSMEESLKRTRDALILTRLTGMDSANAVKALTAAMNTYGHQIKDTTELVSKFAAVDVKFAVSAEDFADAISRTGAAAKGAGVDINELIGIVTAAQQQTARGGKVIGNSLKTIFTRIGKTSTLNQLEQVGIAVRDLEGNTIGAKKILTDLANTFDKLSAAQQAQVTQSVGGVFQINILKAVLSDAAKQNGIMAQATSIASGATDEAITKNEMLRQTMAALASETGMALKEVSAALGEIMLAPGIEKILNTVKGIAEGITGMLGDGEEEGNRFAKGVLAGLGNILTGPGLVILTVVFGKLFFKAFQYGKDSLKSLIGVTTEKQKQAAIQSALVDLFGRSSELNKEMLRTDIDIVQKEKTILSLLREQTKEANLLNAVSKDAAKTLFAAGYKANLSKKTNASGYIPNFSEREQAAKGGYAAGNIRTMNMPGQGGVIYNSAETVKNFPGMKQPGILPPKGSRAGKNYRESFGQIHGFDPYAAGGYVPNFNKEGLPSPRAKKSEKWDSAKKVIDATQYATMLIPSVFPDTVVQTEHGKNVTMSDLEKKKALTREGIGHSAIKGPGSKIYGLNLNRSVKYNLRGLDPDKVEGREMGWSTDSIIKGLQTQGYAGLGAAIGNSLKLGDVPGITDKDIIQAMNDPSSGAKGAINSVAGAIFEGALNKRLNIKGGEAAKSKSGLIIGGDFDVRHLDAAAHKHLEALFGSGIAPLADYKNSASDDNRKSFAKKVLQDMVYKKSSLLDLPSGSLQESGGAMKWGSKKRARGFIPSFAAGDAMWGLKVHKKNAHEPGAVWTAVVPGKDENEAITRFFFKYPAYKGSHNVRSQGQWPSASLTDWGPAPNTPGLQWTSTQPYQKKYNLTMQSMGGVSSAGLSAFGGNRSGRKGGKSMFGGGYIPNFAKGSGFYGPSGFTGGKGEGKSPGLLGGVPATFKKYWDKVPPVGQAVLTGAATVGTGLMSGGALFGTLGAIAAYGIIKALKQEGKAEPVLKAMEAKGAPKLPPGFHSNLMGKLQPGMGVNALGFIPNYADPLSDAIGRERGAGVPVSKIRVGRHPALMGASNPMGFGVTNTTDEPRGLTDVFGANGVIPNYAMSDNIRQTWDFISSKSKQILSDKQKEWVSSDAMQKKSQAQQIQMISVRQKSNNAGIKMTKEESIEAMKQLEFSKEETIEAMKQKDLMDGASEGDIGDLFDATDDEGVASGGLGGWMKGKMKTLDTKAKGTKIGGAMHSLGEKMTSGMGGMAMMMGAPMVAGMITEGNETSAAAMGTGGALSGAATGASMGMMFGPWGAAIGAAAGGLMGLVGGLQDADKASRDLADSSRKEAAEKDKALLTQSFGAMSDKMFQASRATAFDAAADITGTTLGANYAPHTKTGLETATSNLSDASWLTGAAYLMAAPLAPIVGAVTAGADPLLDMLPESWTGTEGSDKIDDALQGVFEGNFGDDAQVAAKALGLEGGTFGNTIQFTRENEGDWLDYADLDASSKDVAADILNRSIGPGGGRFSGGSRGAGLGNWSGEGISSDQLAEYNETLGQALEKALGAEGLEAFSKSVGTTATYFDAFGSDLKDAGIDEMPKNLSEAMAGLAHVDFSKGKGAKGTAEWNKSINDKLGTAGGVIDKYIEGMSDADEVQIEIDGEMKVVNKAMLKKQHEKAKSSKTEAEFYKSLGNEASKRLEQMKQQRAATIKSLNFQKIQVKLQSKLNKALMAETHARMMSAKHTKLWAAKLGPMVNAQVKSSMAFTNGMKDAELANKQRRQKLEKEFKSGGVGLMKDPTLLQDVKSLMGSGTGGGSANALRAAGLGKLIGIANDDDGSKFAEVYSNLDTAQAEKFLEIMLENREITDDTKKHLETLQEKLRSGREESEQQLDNKKEELRVTKLISDVEAQRAIIYEQMGRNQALANLKGENEQRRIALQLEMDILDIKLKGAGAKLSAPAQLKREAKIMRMQQEVRRDHDARKAALAMMNLAAKDKRGREWFMNNPSKETEFNRLREDPNIKLTPAKVKEFFKDADFFNAGDSVKILQDYDNKNRAIDLRASKAATARINAMKDQVGLESLFTQLSGPQGVGIPQMPFQPVNVQPLLNPQGRIVQPPAQPGQGQGVPAQGQGGAMTFPFLNLTGQPIVQVPQGPYVPSMMTRKMHEQARMNAIQSQAPQGFASPLLQGGRRNLQGGTRGQPNPFLAAIGTGAQPGDYQQFLQSEDWIAREHIRSVLEETHTAELAKMGYQYDPKSQTIEPIAGVTVNRTQQAHWRPGVGRHQVTGVPGEDFRIAAKQIQSNEAIQQQQKRTRWGSQITTDASGDPVGIYKKELELKESLRDNLASLNVEKAKIDDILNTTGSIVEARERINRLGVDLNSVIAKNANLLKIALANKEKLALAGEAERSAAKQQVDLAGDLRRHIELIAAGQDETATLQEKILIMKMKEAALADRRKAGLGTEEVEREIMMIQQLANERKALADAGKTTFPAWKAGFRDARSGIQDEIRYFDYDLAQNVTMSFRDGMVEGMQAAINKAEDLEEVLSGIAMNFLSMIQKAYLQKAANIVVDALPFSGGGQVPARVSNGEYVMSRGAVNRYGGGFMHGLNARGKIPGYDTGGAAKQIYHSGRVGREVVERRRRGDAAAEPGSALATGFGGGEGWESGNLYQKKAMSGFFYSGQAGSQLLDEDASTAKGILAERERKRQEKKAKKRQLMQMLISTALTAGLTYGMGQMFGGAGAAATGTGGATGNIGGGASITPTGGSGVYSGSGVMESSLDLSDARLEQMFPSSGGAAAQWSRGGLIRRYAPGGYISGKSGIDQIPAMLSEGEYVIKQSSVQRLGRPLLDRINAGKFADGGPTTPIAEQSETSATGGGNTNNINISVNVAKGGEKKDKADTTGESPTEAVEEDKKNKALAEKLRAEVVTIIVEEQRPGGLLDDK